MKIFWSLLLACLFLITVVNAKPGDISIAYATVELNVTNEAPIITSLSLGASPVYDDSNLFCNVTATDRENEQVTYSYAWYVNGRNIDYDKATLSGNFRDSDLVSCVATPADSVGNGTTALTSITISAPPPGARAIKYGLTLLGASATTQEIALHEKQGLASVTGFAVSEASTTASVSIGFIVFLVLLLVIVNFNLIMRIRRTRYA